MPDDRSWIKLYRGLMTNEQIFNSDGLTRLWIFCLMSANWQTSEMVIPGTSERIEVPRGCFITGQNALHKKLYPTEDGNGFKVSHDYLPSSKTLWRRVQLLEKLGSINTKSLSNRCTMITICNFETYQNRDSNFVQPTVQPVVQPTGTSKEFKNSIIQEGKKDSSLPEMDEKRFDPASVFDEQFNTQKMTDAEKELAMRKAIFPTSHTREFKQFMNAFPPGGRSRQKQAWDIWQRLIVEFTSHDSEGRLTYPQASGLLIAAAERYAKSDKGKSEFVMSMATFLEDERFRDEDDAWKMVDQDTDSSGVKIPPITDEERYGRR